jgi:hypothetical protein
MTNKESIMQHKLATLLAAVVFAGSVSFLAACPDEEKHGKPATTVAHDGKAPCGSTKTAGAPCAKSGCPHAKSATTVADSTGDSRVQAILARLPHVVYKVGDETIGCEKSAEAMAEKTGKPIQYIIGEEVLDSHCAAEVRLTEILDAQIESFTAMQFAVGDETVGCPVTAKAMAEKKKAEMSYRVAGVDFKSQEQASKAAELVSDAVDHVKLSYKVGEESFCCDRMAGMKAKETGKSMTFVVAGEETSCDKHAKLLLAQAKIKAAIESALAASSS